MSAKRKMKTIDLETLDKVERKASSNIMKKTVVVVLILSLLGIGGWGAQRMMTDEVLASRFTVNKMNCPGCVVTVKEATAKIPGVIETDVSLAAQNATIRFYESQTSSDDIRDAITKAGFPVTLDGIFRSDGIGVSEPVLATVNGHPLFRKDADYFVIPESAESRSQASIFFDLVGKTILLQAADANHLVIQPYEIGAEIDRLMRTRKILPKQLIADARKKYGSVEKYSQVVGQRMGIRRLVKEHILQGGPGPYTEEGKIMEWLGDQFKAAEVKIFDWDLKKDMQALAGEDEWEKFWPRMISRDTALKQFLVGTPMSLAQY